MKNLDHIALQAAEQTHQAEPVTRDVLMALVIEIADKAHAAGAIGNTFMDEEVAAIVDRYAAQPPAVPDGYALVPIEPTEEMLDAASQIAIDWPDGFPNHLEGYRAMLAAAQKGGK